MDRLIAVLGTVGSWLGSAAATLLALILASIVDKVPEKFYPIPKPPGPMEAPVRQVSNEVHRLSLQVVLLREFLAVDRGEPMIYEMAFRATPRPRFRQGHANAA